MRRVKLEKFTAWLCIIDILAGFILGSGIFEGAFHWELLKMFTVLNAVWALLYYLLELRYLQVGGRGFISTAMRFTVMINATGMALISVIYLRPMHASFVGPDLVALVMIQYVLPGLMLLDYLVGLKHHFGKKHILYAMCFPLIYNLTAVLMGALGHGFGLDSAKYPYPFLNIDQLGRRLVLMNIVLLIIFQYLYCRLWIVIDKMGKKHD